ncbi:MAG: Gfo/Idh/MocA family oxidoreductase [Firmicutes bacterium]|jgi:predicted dehydrogenase|nr:Gfo/Idh/MocA family oxidoreductase [Bacillota bacterium]HOB22563.1 Gfo/Idh/MocA family oxidoreductase [Bacillota bacterium]HQD39096.1 Gfo/Idh/MocA family oxidoreductase [Bacillota bacterium]
MGRAVKIGLVGAGTVAEFGHLPALCLLPEVEVVAVADIDRERAKTIAQRFKVPKVYGSFQELLNEPCLDAVVVATPVETHYEIVMAAAEKKLHVLCEKPIAATVGQGIEMMEVMERQGLVLGVNFLLRFSEPLLTMKKWVDAGRIGKASVLRLIFNSPGPGWREQKRLDSLMTRGGGPIFDCGVHYFDLARWFTGSEFAEIQAKGVHLQGYSNPDHVICSCRLRDGTLVLIEESWIYTLSCAQTKRYRCYEIIGSTGTISYNTDTEKLVLYSRDETVTLNIPRELKAFAEVYRHFLAAVKGKIAQNKLPTGWEGVKALEAAEIAQQSLKGDKFLKKEFFSFAANI